jgi:WD40 repeat-containing protein SMU1
VIELCELKENETARTVLEKTMYLVELKELEPERYIRLNHLVNMSEFDEYIAYQSSSKQQRRLAIAQSFKEEVKVAPHARLLSLIGQALKYQQQEGLIPPSLSDMTHYDLFTGKTITGLQSQSMNVSGESCPSIIDNVIKFGKKSHPTCVAFSPDGEYFVTGSVDGFVEVWDYRTGKINMELAYQAQDQIMMHDTSVHCISFSSDSLLLASGDSSGVIKVWNIKTGDCIRRMEKAHTKSITSIVFSPDNTQILSTSQDMTAKIHGLNSGTVLKQFVGHHSFVNCVVYTPDGSSVITGSSDGTMKVWDIRTMECLSTFHPNAAEAKKSAHHPSVLHIFLLPNTTDQLVVCTASPTVYITNLKGEMIKSFTIEGTSTGLEFATCTISPKGSYIYAVGENHTLYCFNTISTKVDHSMPIHTKDVIGLVHHPHSNLIASYSTDSTVKLWKPAE